MTRKRAMKVLARSLGVLLLIGSLAGCTRQEPPDVPPQGGAPEESSAATGSGGAIAAPGIYELDDGQVEAVGTLTYFDLEGGFWAVTEERSPRERNPNPTAGVIAVIPNAEEVRPDVRTLEGEYVAVRGTRMEGPSMRMAGPEIEAGSIEVVGGDVTTTP